MRMISKPFSDDLRRSILEAFERGEGEGADGVFQQLKRKFVRWLAGDLRSRMLITISESTHDGHVIADFRAPMCKDKIQNAKQGGASNDPTPTQRRT
jgi:hypothetical protein